MRLTPCGGIQHVGGLWDRSTPRASGSRSGIRNLRLAGALACGWLRQDRRRPRGPEAPRPPGSQTPLPFDGGPGTPGPPAPPEARPANRRLTGRGRTPSRVSSARCPPTPTLCVCAGMRKPLLTEGGACARDIVAGAGDGRAQRAAVYAVSPATAGGRGAAWRAVFTRLRPCVDASVVPYPSPSPSPSPPPRLSLPLSLPLPVSETNRAATEVHTQMCTFTRVFETPNTSTRHAYQNTFCQRANNLHVVKPL